MTFIDALEKALREHSNKENAVPMEHYMKNNFPFLGIKAEKRRAICKTVWLKHKTEVQQNFRTIVWKLFQLKEREFHQCGIDILVKESKNRFVLEDVDFIEQLILTNSWWDSVDVLAKYVFGGYLEQFPNATISCIEKFSNSEALWLNRSALLFQLNYKSKTNFELLRSECEKHKLSNEFFIQKAIGWALREYSKYNPSAVLEYVNGTNLKPLSKREAIRNI